MDNNYPIIRIELQGMKETILHAFTARQEELTAAVGKALDRAIETIDIERMVQPVVAEALKKAVESSLQSALWQPEVRQMLDDLLLRTVREKLADRE